MKICPSCKQTYDNAAKFCSADGSKLLTDNQQEIKREDLTGQAIANKYAIVQKLQPRGAWNVYLGKMPATGQKIMIKSMPIKNLEKGRDIEVFEKRLQLFCKKIHPGLIKVIDYGNFGSETFFVITEYIEGKNLKNILETAKPFSISLSLTIVRQILVVLNFLHKKGIYHLGLAPDKIILASSKTDGHFVCVDASGLFIPPQEPVSSPQVMPFEQLEYTAPEVFFHRPVGPYSDIYFAGVLLYRMLTGELPYPSELLLSFGAERFPPIPNANNVRPEISKKLNKAIVLAIAWDFSIRHNNASKLLKTLGPSTNIKKKIQIGKGWWAIFSVTLIVLFAPRELYKKWQYFSSNVKVFTPETKKEEKKWVGTPGCLDVHKNVQKEFQRELFLMKKAEDNNLLNDMVKIPGGWSTLGTTRNKGYAKKIKLSPFFIDCTEVTNIQYKKFIQETGHKAPRYWKNKSFAKSHDHYPVVEVNWYDANLFAKWQKKKLPSEAQWEKAAHGGKGQYYWPWGNTFYNDYANVGKNTLASVGSFRQKWNSTWIIPAELVDISGNVWEWTDNWYDPPLENDKVIKGGSYLSNPIQAQTTYRDGYFAAQGRRDIGFRCVKEVQIK